MKQETLEKDPEGGDKTLKAQQKSTGKWETTDLVNDRFKKKVSLQCICVILF